MLLLSFYASDVLVGLTYNQLNNNLTSQAATMSTHGVPNDVLSNLDPFALLILIPVCDLIVSFPVRRLLRFHSPSIPGLPPPSSSRH